MKAGRNSLITFLKSNIPYYILGYLSIFLFNLIKVPFLTHTFEPAELGNYALITTFLSYFDVVFLSWCSGTLWRYINEEKFKSVFYLFSLIFPLFVLMTISASLFCLLLSLLFFDFGWYLTTLGLLSIISSASIALFYVYLQNQGFIKKWALCISLQNMGSFVILFLLVAVFRFRIEGIFLGTVVYNLIFLTFLIFKHFRKITISVSSNKIQLPRILISYSLLLAIINIFFTILNNADRFIIDYYQGKEAVGIYAQSYGLASFGFSSLIQLFNSALLPFYNRNLALAKDHTENQKIVQTYILIYTPLVVFLILNSTAVTNILLGEKYEGHASVFNLIVLGIYFYGFANFLEIRMKFNKRVSQVLLILFFSVLVNLILNLLLLKNYGISYAAFSTFISYFLLAVLLVWHNKEFALRLYSRSLFLKLTLASLCFYVLSRTMAMIYFSNNLTLLAINSLIALLTYLIFLKKEFYLIRFLFKRIA